MKKILKSDTFKMFIYMSGIFTLINIFTYIANIYNMTTIHRIISILVISFTQTLFIPFYTLFNKELHK